MAVPRELTGAVVLFSHRTVDCQTTYSSFTVAGIFWSVLSFKHLSLHSQSLQEKMFFFVGILCAKGMYCEF